MWPKATVNVLEEFYCGWEARGGGGGGASAPTFLIVGGGSMVCLCPPLLTPHFYFPLDIMFI